MQKKVLGVDPGYDRCGIAIIEKKENKEELIFSDCIETSKNNDYYFRFQQVIESIENLIEKEKPDVLAIENVFFNKNQKTSSKISEIRGAIIYLALKNKIKVNEYTPLQIKLAVTGNGRADKKSIYTLLPKLIKINKKIKLDDEFDAIACALTEFVLGKSQK